MHRMTNDRHLGKRTRGSGDGNRGSELTSRMVG
jgi:hypothetical protein